MGSGADVIETQTIESDHPLNHTQLPFCFYSVIENNGSSDIFGYIELGEGDAINPDGQTLYPNGTPVFVNGRMRNSQFDTIK